MKAQRGLLERMARLDEKGEVLEYALIAGLVVVAAIAIITTVGGQMLSRWNTAMGGG